MRRIAGLRPPPWLALVGAAAFGQAAQLLWLVASSRTMSADAFGTVLGAQALYVSLQIVVDSGAWLYGARAAARGELSDDARGRIVGVRLELAAMGVLVFGAFAVAAGGAMPQAVLPYALALLLFAVMNTWEPFGRGHRAPYMSYLVLRSLMPALVAWALLAAAPAQPVAVPGLAECVTIMTALVVFRLRPLRQLRRALEVRSGPRAAILTVSLPQIAAQLVVSAGTLTLSLVGAAASAGMVAAGVKLLGGFTTLVGSAMLGFFRGLAQLGPLQGGGGRRVGGGYPELLSGVSWFSLALMSALALAAPLLSAVLLDASGRESVTTMVAVLSAMPPAAFVAALTSPLIAQRQEAGVAATYVTGVAVAAAGVCLVLLIAGPSAAGMATVLPAAQLAMAVQLAARARALLGEVTVGDLLLRATTAAGVGLAAAFLPAVRIGLLTALFVVAAGGLAASSRRLLRARRPSSPPAVEPGAAG
jgi:O-antigen/teichoic acid export membrane protein